MGFSEPPAGPGGMLESSTPPERAAAIARRRDALLAAARGERTNGDTGSAARLGGLGVQFAIAILLFLSLGNWVDHKFGSGPWGVLGGLCVGFASGLYLMLRALRDERQRADEPRTHGKGS